MLCFFSSFLLVLYCTPNDFFVICLFFKNKAEAETNTKKTHKKTYELHYTNLHRQHTFNLQKQICCTTAVKFQTPRTTSMLTVSLDCLFWIAPLVSSSVYFPYKIQ